MNKDEAVAMMQQIHFFNDQFHGSENQLHLKDFHALMRMSKNRCQLILLKFASPDLVWIRPDLNQLHQEWSLGLYGFPDEYARHIPLYILQQGLSEELLEAWNIK